MFEWLGRIEKDRKINLTDRQYDSIRSSSFNRMLYQGIAESEAEDERYHFMLNNWVRRTDNHLYQEQLCLWNHTISLAMCKLSPIINV